MGKAFTLLYLMILKGNFKGLPS